MTARRKPTRRDLLIVVARLNTILGSMLNTYTDDRNEQRATDIIALAKRGDELSQAALAQDPPLVMRGPWADGYTADCAKG